MSDIKSTESIDAFRASRTEMTASAFGALVGDGQWEGDESPFLVYADTYWIEALDDGRHMVTIENTGGITSDTVTLADLEQQLYDWVRLSDEMDKGLPSNNF